MNAIPVICALSVLTACQPAPSTASSRQSVQVCGQGPVCFEVADPLAVADACPARRQVAMLPAAGPCPPAAGWSRSKLFPGTSSYELSTYCVYQFPGTPTPADLAGLPAGAAPDCGVTTGMGHAWEQNNAAAFEAKFFERIERLSSLPPIPASPAATKVVIVDSAVNQGFPEPGNGQLEHGRVMGEIVRKLGCPTGPGVQCYADVASVLALPLARNAQGNLQPNYTLGGHLGRLTDMARGVVDGTDYALSAPGSQRVIINLSVGWDGRWGGANPGFGGAALVPPVRAVYSAITYASCRGALVISAAGNGPGGPGSLGGAAYPAAWESEPAPNTAGCAVHTGLPVPSTSLYAPLLHAVGAVGAEDRPLLVERASSRPRLVAPGDHVAMTRVAGPHSGAFTGTSVAAAGVSGIAATVWAYRTGWSRHRVMQALYDEGVGLNLGVHTYLEGHGVPQVRRASLCRAVNHACTERGDCGIVLPCAAPVSTPVGPVVATQSNPVTFSNPAPAELSFPAVWSSVGVGSPCDVTVKTANPQTLDNPCPSAQYHSRYAGPFAVPHPIIISCPSCGISVSYESLYVGIADDAPDDLSDPKLRIVLDSGDEELIDLSVIPSGDIRGEEYKIGDLPVDVGEITKASIEFVVDGDYSSADQIVIID